MELSCRFEWRIKAYVDVFLRQLPLHRWKIFFFSAYSSNYNIIVIITLLKKAQETFHSSHYNVLRFFHFVEHFPTFFSTPGRFVSGKSSGFKTACNKMIHSPNFFQSRVPWYRAVMDFFRNNLKTEFRVESRLRSVDSYIPYNISNY